ETRDIEGSRKGDRRGIISQRLDFLERGGERNGACRVRFCAHVRTRFTPPRSRGICFPDTLWPACHRFPWSVAVLGGTTAGGRSARSGEVSREISPGDASS